MSVCVCALVVTSTHQFSDLILGGQAVSRSMLPHKLDNSLTPRVIKAARKVGNLREHARGGQDVVGVSLEDAHVFLAFLGLYDTHHEINTTQQQWVLPHIVIMMTMVGVHV